MKELYPLLNRYPSIILSLRYNKLPNYLAVYIPPISIVVALMVEARVEI